MRWVEMTKLAKEHALVESLEAIGKEVFSHIDNDRLILYAVSILGESEIEPTFDSVVVAAFKLFPSRFSLIGFPEYPDAKRVHDCLWHCTYKTKMWLSGNAKSGFNITEKGRYILKETKRRLSGEVEAPRKFGTKARRKEVYFIDLLRKTSAFRKFTVGNGNTISSMEIRELLRVGNEASKEILRKNLQRYLEYAQKLEASDAQEFLKFVQTKWGDLFD
jgi:hypothetical protein